MFLTQNVRFVKENEGEEYHDIAARPNRSKVREVLAEQLQMLDSAQHRHDGLHCETRTDDESQS